MRKAIPLRVLVGFFVFASLIPIHLAAAASTAELAVTSRGRARVNFNADWRFTLGDVPDAQSPDFDDAKWESTGLPHSFSIPYFRSASFYVGYGWYRKTLSLPALPAGRRLSLEFEGAFQEAEIFVNGIAVGHHRGGYTGFTVDITSAVHPGKNVIAVRVNNKWDPTLAPRAGEHVFSGGLYRDVWLTATNDVHVAWTGTRVTTPELSDASGRAAVDTEVRNESVKSANVILHTEIVDERGSIVSTLPDAQVTLPSGQTIIGKQESGAIANPRLWSPETPVLYRAVTSLLVGGKVVDRFETEFGFRWIVWTADKGFFLNGKHRYFRGANVHQDQAGWGDAVTNRAIDRDVQLIKDAGFDFIRGSHYPHDPHFAEATDRIGLMFLSEESFWGTAGFKSPWASSAYPTEPTQDAAFDASVKQQLAEMIRINRNHPSIIAWGMDNEVFFSAKETMPQVRRLLAEEVALTHELDPTRPASIDGAQRGDIDHIGDIAGYNGDGAFLFPNPGIPNFVAEYGLPMEDRPGPYEPGWGDLPRTPGAEKNGSNPYPWRLSWRSGETIWAGFDHGSIAGRKFGGMGMIDYFRLPKRQWYWYRNTYRHIAPPEWPQPGRAASLRLTSSSPTIQRADGTDDVQLVVTVIDAQGRAISNSPPVRLTIESGPGELPTGRSILFAPNSDIQNLDGRAAIAMRSWQSGVTRLRATSPGLKDGVLEIRILEGPPFVAGVTPVAVDRPYRPSEGASDEKTAAEERFGWNNPTAASSSAADHSSRLVDDGDPSTYWCPRPGDADPWVSVDPERILQYRRLLLTFPKAADYGFVAEIETANGAWEEIASEAPGADTRRVREIATRPLRGKRIRIKIHSTDGVAPALSEIVIVGVIQTQ
jgi:glycosyl hydrolase family 2/F5/8 type C domain-containing protein